MSQPAQPAASSAARRIELAGANGIILIADSYGDEAAPPVLLAHGGGQTRHAWGGTAASLAQAGFHAVSLDLRGHGDSSWAEDGDYRLDRFVDDLMAVRETFSRKPALVGASLGGMASLIAAGERAPARFAALVLVDIAPRIERAGNDRILAFMRGNLEQGFATIEDAADAVASYVPHRQRPTDLHGLAKNLRRRPDGRWRWHWDPRFLDGRKRIDGVHYHERLKEAAADLAIPALLVRGRLSDVISEESVREFLALCPHARFIDVAQAGHMVAGDRNDAFTQAVVDFLRAPGAPAGN